MKIFAETERLILREVEYSDKQDLFDMDADPLVHLYIDNTPVKSIDEITKVIGMLQKQYLENGIGRWAVVDKTTNECVGWAGLKYFNKPLNKHVGKEGLTPTEIPRVMEVDANVLAEKMKGLKNSSLKVCFDYLPQENHATILHQAVSNAFKLLYSFNN